MRNFHKNMVIRTATKRTEEIPRPPRKHLIPDPFCAVTQQSKLGM